jgi:hypothetical protein
MFYRVCYRTANFRLEKMGILNSSANNVPHFVDCRRPAAAAVAGCFVNRAFLGNRDAEKQIVD